MYRRRFIRNYSKKGKRNLFATIILTVIILYATITWGLPNFINAIGYITSIVKPSSKQAENVAENPHLAPPVLNIPYEFTNNPSINIAGFATPNSKVILYIDDVEKKTTQSKDDGSFLFENIELVLGTNNIYGKVVDEQGKESLSSKTIKIFYDNEKPKLEISNPQDGTKIQGVRKVSIEGSTEADAKVYVNDSQVIVDMDGKFKIELSLNDGENIFKIKAVDKASNETTDERRVDFTP